MSLAFALAQCAGPAALIFVVPALPPPSSYVSLPYLLPLPLLLLVLLHTIPVADFSPVLDTNRTTTRLLCNAAVCDRRPNIRRCRSFYTVGASDRRTASPCRLLILNHLG